MYNIANISLWLIDFSKRNNKIPTKKIVTIFLYLNSLDCQIFYHIKKVKWYTDRSSQNGWLPILWSEIGVLWDETTNAQSAVLLFIEQVVIVPWTGLSNEILCILPAQLAAKPVVCACRVCHASAFHHVNGSKEPAQ